MAVPGVAALADQGGDVEGLLAVAVLVVIGAAGAPACVKPGGGSTPGALSISRELRTIGHAGCRSGGPAESEVQECGRGGVVARTLPVVGGDFADSVADKYLQPAGFCKGRGCELGASVCGGAEGIDLLVGEGGGKGCGLLPAEASQSGARGLCAWCTRHWRGSDRGGRESDAWAPRSRLLGDSGRGPRLREPASTGPRRWPSVLHARATVPRRACACHVEGTVVLLRRVEAELQGRGVCAAQFYGHCVRASGQAPPYGSCS